MKTKITLCWLMFALLIAACSRPGGMAGSSALKPIEQAALQIMVDTTAKALLVPGAVVLAIWIKALVAGRALDPAYQRRWLDSLKPEDPNKPKGQKYGYGISQYSWGPNSIYFHGGETAGYNSKISYDPG